MPGEFEGRRVVVTGGTGALGSAVVGMLLDAGARCDIPCMAESELARFPYGSDQRVRVVRNVDLREEPVVEEFFKGVGVGLWASIHLAGGFAMSPVEKTSKAAFVDQMQHNALSCFLCCREAVSWMKAGPKPGAEGRGRIVNVAARPGLVPDLGGGMVAYTAAKAAVAAITQAVAAEVAGDGILVNAVVPSIMDTPANRKAMPDADHSKWPGVAEVAATILFLASPANRVTRGGLVPVYGRS